MNIVLSVNIIKKAASMNIVNSLKKSTERTFLFGVWYFMAFTSGRCYSYNEFEWQQATVITNLNDRQQEAVWNFDEEHQRLAACGGRR